MKTINIVILVLVIVAVVLGIIYVMMRSNVMAPGASPTTTTQQNSVPQTGTTQTQTPQPSAPQTSQPQTSNPAQPSTAAVRIQNFAFSPTPLTVVVGTAVTWTNMDSVNHQIKSTTFNSSPISQGQTYSFTFTTAGTYDYSCAIHPTMHGQIIVK